MKRLFAVLDGPVERRGKAPKFNFLAMLIMALFSFVFTGNSLLAAPRPARPREARPARPRATRPARPRGAVDPRPRPAASTEDEEKGAEQDLKDSSKVDPKKGADDKVEMPGAASDESRKVESPPQQEVSTTAEAAPPPPPPPPVRTAARLGRSKPVFPAVKSKWGSVQLWGLLQTRFVLPLRGTFSGDYQTFKGNTFNADQNMAFEVQRVRILLTGHLLSKNFTYMFQGDAAAGPPWLLDVKLGYKIPCVPGLSISIGRFLPNFSLMMPTLITRLETAEYPILLTEGGWAPWRQLGLQVNYKVGLGPGTLGAYLGIFNGPANGWTDDNPHKDIMLRADYSMELSHSEGFMVGINSWFGFPKCSFTGDPASSTCNERDSIRNRADTDIKAGVMARYFNNLTSSQGITAMAEFMLRHYIPWAENRDTYMGYGAWAHVGYLQDLLFMQVEGVARFDFLAPNTNVDSNHAWRVTAGANLYFQKIHSHVKINYIYQNNSDNYTGTASWIDVKYPDDPLVFMNWETKNDLHMVLVQLNTEF